MKVKDLELIETCPQTKTRWFRVSVFDAKYITLGNNIFGISFDGKILDFQGVPCCDEHSEYKSMQNFLINYETLAFYKTK